MSMRFGVKIGWVFCFGLIACMLLFSSIAESYGHVGIKIEQNSELKSGLEKAFSMKDRLVFVDVYVDPEEHVYPMLIANHSLEDMWLSKDKKT